MAYWGQSYCGGQYFGARYFGGTGTAIPVDTPIPSVQGAKRSDAIALLNWAVATPRSLPGQLTTRKRGGIPGSSIDAPMPRLQRQNPLWPLPYVAPQQQTPVVPTIFTLPPVDRPPPQRPLASRTAAIFVWHLPPLPLYGVQPRYAQINPERNIAQVKALKVRTDRIPLMVWALPDTPSPATQPRQINVPDILTPLVVDDPPPKDMRTNPAIDAWFVPQPWPKTANVPYAPIIPDVNDPPVRGANAKGMRAVYLWPQPLFSYIAVQIRNQNIPGIPGMSVDDPPVRGTRWRERQTRIAALEPELPQYIYIPQIAATLPIPDNPPFCYQRSDTIACMLWNIPATRAVQGMTALRVPMTIETVTPTPSPIDFVVILGNFPR